MAVSDDNIVYRLDNTIRTETTDGRLLGSISVPPETRGVRVAETAGPGRLYLNLFSGDDRIVDFKGQELVRLHPPDGWGFRHGWTADGGRLLFDHFTRTVPWGEKFADFLGRLMGAPEEANGETITVVDTRKGGTCFALESRWKLFGPAGGYHADLSPSGRWVVASTLTGVSIYRLSDVCAE